MEKTSDTTFKVSFSGFQKKFFIYYAMGMLLAIALFVMAAFLVDRRAVARHERMFNEQQLLQTLLAKQAMDDHIHQIQGEAKILANHFASQFVRDGAPDMRLLDELFRIKQTKPVEVLAYVWAESGNVVHARFAQTPNSGEAERLHQEWVRTYWTEMAATEQSPFVPRFHLTADHQMSAMFFPVRTHGELRGALMVIMDLRPMIMRYIAPMRSGRYGAGYLLNEKGLVVYDHETEIIGANVIELHTKYPDLMEVDKRLISEPSGMSEYTFTVKREGRVSRKLIAWNTVRTGSRKIVIALSAPDIEIDETLSDLRLQRILLGGFLGLILVTMGFVFFRKGTREEMQRLQAENLRKTNEELRRLDGLKDEFLANTSHELRTPLNGIIGIAESLIDGATGPLTEEQAYNLSLIVSSGLRLTNLVNDILDFSKMRHEDLELRIRPVDMYALSDVVIRLSRVLVRNKNIEIVNRIAPDTPAVGADEDRLHQILYNLIGNAIKFTEAGTISLSARGENGYLAITVSDTGIGISQEKTDRIFVAFEQADGTTARKYGGTGLGLAVTKNLVELHGGNIRVVSEPGKGSDFTFTMPLSADKAKPTERADMPGSPVRIAGIQGKEADAETSDPPADGSLKHTCDGEMCRILVVDDEPVNLQVLNNQLRSESYSVTLAADGKEAIAAVESGQNFDIVLLDIMMPGMSGYEVCQRLRDKHPASELPVVMLTAKNQVEDLVAGFGAGASDFVTKPFSKQELVSRIETHISLKYLYQSRLKAETEAKVLAQEMALAKKIQTSLLPKLTDDFHPDFQIAASMLPAEEVGGDFYDISYGKTGDFWLAIGDVSGHGVTPGLIMMMAQTVHTTVTSNMDCDARDVVVKINEVLYKNVRERLNESHFMTFAALKYLGDGRFQHAGAHLSMIVFRRKTGACELVRTRGVYLNFKKDISKATRNSEFSLGPDDVLVLYTDGLTEAENPEGKMLDIGGLVESVERHAHQEPEAMKERVMADVLRWCDDTLADDMTLVIVRRKEEAEGKQMPSRSHALSSSRSSRSSRSHAPRGNAPLVSSRSSRSHAPRGNA